MNATKAKLLTGALDALKTHGISGASARAIATAAGVNQALVFYHFGSVDELLAAACTYGAEQRVAMRRADFAEVTTLSELLTLGRTLHAEEQADGNVAMLAQMLAGAQTDAKLAPATAAGLNLWVAEIEQVMTRVLADTPLAEFVDVAGLSKAAAAAFVGLELYEGVDAAGATQALDALEQLGALMTMLDELGPVGRTVLRGKLRKTVTSSRQAPRSGT